jgi:type IV pilus assembly protein PilM
MTKAFGLDIGASSIKLVWLEGSIGHFSLKSAGTFPLSGKGMESESPLDQQEMANNIAKAVKDANIGLKAVSVALPDNQVYTKVLDMPMLSEKELSSAIFWEAEQYIPVPLANITLAWDVLRPKISTPNGDKMQVLMVGAPTILVEKYKRIMSMAGLEIKGLESEIISAVRSLVIGKDFPSSLIVNIGAITTSLALVRDGSMTFTYSMSVGGNALNRAIAADFGLDTKQAEEYKKTYGIAGNAVSGKIGKSTEPILNSILNEIKKTLAFDTQKNHDLSPVRQLVLSGGTAMLPGIDLYFANNSGIETVVANPWKVLSSQNLPKQIADSASSYAIAVGLAMKDYE